MTNKNDSIHNSEQGPLDGLTKREYFAAMALQGILANTYKMGNNGHDIYAVNNISVAKQAVLFADSLIEALNKTTKH